MSDDDALLAAIRQAPDDDAPRLIYADWLDENGQPERADFIRVQIELARQDSPELRKREAELLSAHHEAISGPLASRDLRFRFQRGFAFAFAKTTFLVGRQPASPQHTMYYIFRPDGRWVSLADPMRTANREGIVQMIRTGQLTRITLSRTAHYWLNPLQSPSRIYMRNASVRLSGQVMGSNFYLDYPVDEGDRRTIHCFPIDVPEIDEILVNV
jgi:uncharacterized protein (TIGR02996 family)